MLACTYVVLGVRLLLEVVTDDGDVLFAVSLLFLSNSTSCRDNIRQ